jgi:disulfide bond formation protein DsbB
MLSYKQREIAYILNIVSLLGITIVSLTAIAAQFLLNELPCPLCLLQRAGILAIGIGYMMNIIFGCKSRYFAVSTFAAIFTMFFAIRQVLLHITPNSVGYGDIILGAHMYTWVVVIGSITVLWNCLMSLYLEGNYSKPHNRTLLRIGRITTVMFILTIVSNIGLTFMECGFGQCPDNPVSYKYIL